MSKIINGKGLARAIQLITARKSGDAAKVQAVEHAIALELLGPEALARDADVRCTAYPQSAYMTAFASTEAFAKELQRAIVWYASSLGTKAPKSGKYDPLFTTQVMFKDVWTTRQVVEELGIPHGFYAQHAVKYWAEQSHKRIPRPTQLCAPDVVAHVMGLWADPLYRYQYPLFGPGWDARFGADQYTGDPQQLAYLGLIDQRIADAKVLGYDPAAALGSFLGHAISHEEAEGRYGADFVYQAMEAHAAEVAETAALLANVLPGDAGTEDAAKRV